LSRPTGPGFWGEGGGHSFRVTGAQRLASLGVDVAKIMVLARWAGESVLRYVREAPLDSLPAEVRALEERSGLLEALAGLQAAVKGIESKVDRHKLATEVMVKDLLAKVGPAPSLPFIANGNRKRFKVHVAAVDGPHVLPQQWKTRCGVRFGLWTFTRHECADVFPPDVRCARCFVHPDVSAASGTPASSSDSEAGTDSS